MGHNHDAGTDYGERVTCAQAAVLLGVHVSAVAKLIARGHLHSERRRDGALKRQQVEQLAERRHAEAKERGDRVQITSFPPDPRPDAEHEWLTPAEVAELVGLSQQAITKRLRAGTMPGVQHRGRWWVRRDLLEQLEAARLVERTRRP